MSTVSASATHVTAPVVVVPTTTKQAAPPQTISVLHVVNGEHFSGAERVQSHLGRCLPACQVRADFACVKPGLFAEHVDEAGGEIGTAYRLPMRGRMDLRVAYQLSKRVRREGYDLLHAHTPRTAVLTALASRLSGVPWIYHVHSPAARDSARPLVNRINAMTEWLALQNCAQLITVSNSLLQDTIGNGWPADRVAVVHNGVPVVRPPRSHTPVVGGQWVLGMVALMRPRKGLEIAIEAISHLKNTGHDVRLRCIGPFETAAYRSSIDDKVAQLQIADRIEFTGFAKQVPQALAELDAMVLPSLYGEGLPMVVLEAMAAALPVIATKVEGTPEAIRHGQEGLLAEPQCSLSLAEQITALVEGQYDWQKIAEAACQRHADHFSDTAMAQGTAAVYRDVLSR